jgi:preprotein translocase subunit YajC
MHRAIKFVTPAFVLSLGLAGTIQAAGNHAEGGSSPIPMQVVQAETETIKGTVKKVQGDVYTIKDEQGKELRLRIDKSALQGKEPKEGDKIQAKVLKGSESYNAIQAQKAGQSSGFGQSEMMSGKVEKVQGDVYTIKTDQGKKVELKIDQQALQGSSLKEGDQVQAQVKKSGSEPYEALFAKKGGQSTGSGQTEMMSGKVEKVEGDVYTIKTDQGKKVELKIDQQALQGPAPKKGDQLQAQVKKSGSEPYKALSAQKGGQGSSMQAQSASGKPSGQFTETITGEIKKVEGNVYYVQDSSGKEIRLRLDQSAQQSGDLKKGDKIEALVTKEKELHVISAEPAQ